MDLAALSELYEELKERRRSGTLSGSDLPGSISEALRLDFAPGSKIADMLQKGDVAGVLRAAGLESPIPEIDLVRWFELSSLAERVFADRQKAQQWLARPNAAMGQQRPLDLLKDELGAAIVREALEQIDYGIFA